MTPYMQLPAQTHRKRSNTPWMRIRGVKPALLAWFRRRNSVEPTADCLLTRQNRTKSQYRKYMGSVEPTADCLLTRQNRTKSQQKYRGSVEPTARLLAHSTEPYEVSTETLGKCWTYRRLLAHSTEPRSLNRNTWEVLNLPPTACSRDRTVWNYSCIEIWWTPLLKKQPKLD